MSDPPVAPMRASSTSMIGVAIEVPMPWSAELSGWRAKVGDPQGDFVPPHVTLLPPTPLADGDLGAAEAHLDAVGATHATFELHLAGTGTFRPVSEVVFIAVAAGGPECGRLAGHVRSGPLHRDTEFPYHPHVTVAHGVPAESLDHAADGLAGFEARFEVSAFTLYTHGSDQVWRRRRTFPLGRPPDAGA